MLPLRASVLAPPSLQPIESLLVLIFWSENKRMCVWMWVHTMKSASSAKTYTSCNQSPTACGPEDAGASLLVLDDGTA
jgi:hypothetical protein